MFRGIQDGGLSVTNCAYLVNIRMNPDMTKNKKLDGAFFLATFCGAIIVLFISINISTAFEFPELHKHDGRGDYLKKIMRLADSQHTFLVRQEDAKRAKSAGLFWASDADANGIGVDLLKTGSVFDSIFPGYGRPLRDDKSLWRDYFQLNFGTDSYLDSQPDFSQLGFRVAYSWPGCFRIYEKYGADVLVFGSSEVYKSLSPGYFAKAVTPLFAKPPKVLFCMTAAMPVEAVQVSLRELSRVSTHKPKMILWGYSFWLAYTRSPKLAEYRKDKDQEYQAYLRIRGNWGHKSEHDWLGQAASVKWANFFPKISWDTVLPISVDRIHSLLDVRKDSNAEGLEISQAEMRMSDKDLDRYLDENLTPYYDLASGSTDADCAMSEAAAEIEETVRQMKSSTPNVYLYIPPTTEHHRKTVPACFLPTLRREMRRISDAQGVHFFDKNTEDFSLKNRDFIYPMSGNERFYFDVNHLNFRGGERVADILAAWIMATQPRAVTGGH